MLKVKLLADTSFSNRKYKAGTELTYTEDEYIDWYYKVGRTIPHDVKEMQHAN
jgi:hypothetical protein